MTKFLLGVLFASCTATVAFAQEEAPSLDDLMSPDEIAAEMQELDPENSEGSLSSLISPANTGSEIQIFINKAKAGRSAQKMWVYVDGNLEYYWPVSTGRETMDKAKSGKVYRSVTPVGSWTPYRTTREWRSGLWDADMPFAVWLTGGIAIHASPAKIGKRASGGCIRLAPRNAALLFSMVNSVGRTNVRVTVFDR